MNGHKRLKLLKVRLLLLTEAMYLEGLRTMPMLATSVIVSLTLGILTAACNF